MVVLFNVNGDNLDIGLHLDASCFLFPPSALRFGLCLFDRAQVLGWKTDMIIHRRLDWLLLHACAASVNAA